MTTLGIAVIGQAPRQDIARTFAARLPATTRIVLRGCLDGLAQAQLDALAPRDGDDTLYTRLPGGRDAKISKQAVIARAPATLAALRGDGADVLLFCCTGEFPPIPGDGGVLFPSRILAALAAALLPTGRLAILVPAAEQIGKLSSKWKRPGVDIIAEELVPSAEDDAAAEVAGRLAREEPHLIVMDCMSYGEQTGAVVRRTAKAPTLLAATATARIVEELLA